MKTVPIPSAVTASLDALRSGRNRGLGWFGSENFSHASLTKNRELGIITNRPAVLNGINTMATSDFAGGTTYVQQDAGSVQEAGVDADIDDASDAASPDAGD